MVLDCCTGTMPGGPVVDPRRLNVTHILTLISISMSNYFGHSFLVVLSGVQYEITPSLTRATGQWSRTCYRGEKAILYRSTMLPKMRVRLPLHIKSCWRGDSVVGTAVLASVLPVALLAVDCLN